MDMLMGHDTGLKAHYFKPTSQDLLEGNDDKLGYLSVIDVLTINDENRLKRENEMLKVKKSEFESLKEQVEEKTNWHNLKMSIEEQIHDIRGQVAIALGMPKERIDKSELVFKPGVVDLDAQIMAEMNSKSKKEDNNSNSSRL